MHTLTVAAGGVRGLGFLSYSSGSDEEDQLAFRANQVRRVSSFVWAQPTSEPGHPSRQAGSSLQP